MHVPFFQSIKKGTKKISDWLNLLLRLLADALKQQPAK
jgi:hypothetical protein